jgi:hypothetical protein
LRKEEKDLGEAVEEEEEETALTFLAAALKASLCEMSGLPALMRWISSLQSQSPEGEAPEKEKRKGRRQIDAYI